MDHFQLGRTAFEARQFAEADTHFKRVEFTPDHEELLALRELQYQCAKILRPATCWKEFYVFAYLCKERLAADDFLKLLDAEVAFIPAKQQGTFLSLQAQAYFQNGALTRAHESATLHVEHLLEKKLSAQLAVVAKKYERWFPHSVFFQFILLQSHLLLEDVKAASTQFHVICKTVQRRWAKIEDKTENTKSSLLLATSESARELDSSNGEATILNHKALLQSYLVARKDLAKEDWKKAAELLVHEDSWINLKLVLELAIANGEKSIALEGFAALKRKRGFSFVKLTKHDPGLKNWLLLHAGVRPAISSTDEPSNEITSQDLELDGTSVAILGAHVESDDNEELRAIELNAIKQLELHDPGVELLPDLLITYRTLGFHRVVGWLLRSFSLEKMSEELKRKIQYFKVIHAMDMSESYLGLAQIEEMLGDELLTIDEYKELKYAQGCLYMGLKRHAEARKSFMAVAKVDPAYRQTRERMGRLAED